MSRRFSYRRNPIDRRYCESLRISGIEKYNGANRTSNASSISRRRGVLSSATFDGKIESRGKGTDQELLAELTVTLNQFAQFFHRPLNEDHQLKNGLLNHLAPMLVRLERGITLENPLKEEIMKEDRQAFEQTKQLFSQMPLLSNYEINDDEWAYLALHIMAALEKIKATHKIHALIICATGYGSAQLLKNRVLSEFGETIVVTNVKGYYEINELY